MKPSFVFILQLCIGLFHGLLINQRHRWRTSIRWPLRFFGFWFFGLYAAAIAAMLSELPSGSIEFLLTHMFEPLPATLLVIITGFSLAAAGSVCAAEKIRESL